MIKVENLCKHFGNVVAVEDLSFSVAPGEVLGFLGPNGAGKSTTMKMIAGFLAPSSGSVEVCGHIVGENTRDAQQCIGYLPEGAPSYDDMSVEAFLVFIATVRGFRGAEVVARVQKVSDQLELGSVFDRRIEMLSKGFKRRVGLAQAILHDPRVLILDEPTDGLDPNQKHQVRELIKGLAEDKIVVISTHILEEVDAVCNRAMIIANGSLIADGTPAELEARSPAHRSVHLHLAEDAENLEKLQELAGVKQLEIAPDRRSVVVYPEPDESILPRVASMVHEQGWSVDELHLERGRLDDVFRQITREEVNA